MEKFSDSFITLANGFVELLLGVAHPLVFIVGALGLSLTWLALIERDELDRLGTKPEIGQH
jgi:hypothetical protein